MVLLFFKMRPQRNYPFSLKLKARDNLRKATQSGEPLKASFFSFLKWQVLKWGVYKVLPCIMRSEDLGTLSKIVFLFQKVCFKLSWREARENIALKSVQHLRWSGTTLTNWLNMSGIFSLTRNDTALLNTFSGSWTEQLVKALTTYMGRIV